MADITNIIPGGFSLPETVTESTEQQVRNAMLELGLQPPDVIEIDGQLHRFRSGTKGEGGHGDKPGWYIIYPDGVPAGRIGCWRSGVESVFKADVGRKLSIAEEMAHARRIEEAKKRRNEEQKRKHETAADTVNTIWRDCMGAGESHPYLARKGIKPNGARVTGDGRLVVPLFNDDGELCSLQYIDADGGKLYHAGGKTGGASWKVGAKDDDGVLYIAEGFATAATIHEQTGRPCLVAYSASNLVPVTAQARERYGAQQSIVIVADNDKSGVGQKYADQASAKYGARVVMPPIDGDANDYHQAGHNLAELLTPAKNDWLIPADEFSPQPAPLSWYLKRWLPTSGLIMMHGPSGGGKTFVVLDWCLSIAAGLGERMGHKVKPGTVVYLAGEGHHGLKGRIAVWRQQNKSNGLDMYLSRDGCDLNTPEGYQRVIDSIQATGKAPALIVVDTLHRFLSGDENSAQDTKTMLDACAGLINQYHCAVVLVHHTGVSEEAQHRARGSSAWRGALDIEISISPPKHEGDPIEIIQRKSKDAELAKTMYCTLQSTAINGWYDEDGEPVTSAVVVPADPPVKQEKPKKGDPYSRNLKRFERAWFDSGCEEVDGSPYLTTSALKNWLIVAEEIKESTAEKYMKPSISTGVIGTLLEREVIKKHENGYIVIDNQFYNELMMRKNGEKA